MEMLRRKSVIKVLSLLTDVTVGSHPSRKAVTQVSTDQVMTGASVDANAHFALIGVYRKVKVSH